MLNEWAYVIIFGVVILLIIFLIILKKLPKKQTANDTVANSIEGICCLALGITKNKSKKILSFVKLDEASQKELEYLFNQDLEKLPAGQKEENLKQKAKLLQKLRKNKETWELTGIYYQCNLSKGNVFCKNNGSIKLFYTITLNY